MFVHFRDCLLTGDFGPIRVGSSRHEFDDLLGDPSDASFVDRKRTSVIWRFGSVEFHIQSDILQRVFCEGDKLFDGGDSIQIDPWKLRAGMTMSELRAILDGNNIKHTGADRSDSPDCLVLLDSGFTLGFVLDGNAGLGPTGMRSWSIQAGA